MDIEDEDEMVRLVREDVESGIPTLFPEDEGLRHGEFRIAEGFEGRPVLRTPEDDERDDEIAAVPWVWSANVRSALGIRLDHDTTVEITGMTFVSRSPETGEREFRRYVDWLGAFAQVGIGVFARPVDAEAIEVLDVVDRERREPEGS